MTDETGTIKALSGLLPEELFSSLGLDKKFRAKQIFKWVADGARDYDAMTNLPLSLRQELSAKAPIFSTSVLETLRDPDGTVKLQVSLGEGNAVETVLLTDAAGRKTACVSCQVGCPMGCAFCQTGHIGYARNLDAGEIVMRRRESPLPSGLVRTAMAFRMAPRLSSGSPMPINTILSSRPTASSRWKNCSTISPASRFLA